MYTYTLTFTHADIAVLIDALMKGAARHESYARFNPAGKKTGIHERLASNMRRLKRKFEEAQHD